MDITQEKKNIIWNILFYSEITDLAVPNVYTLNRKNQECLKKILDEYKMEHLSKIKGLDIVRH